MITIHAQRWYRRELHTRLPFRYGIAVMERVPQVGVEIEATIDGQRCRGRAADLLPPKWFTKDPNRAVDDEIAEMQAVLSAAAGHAVGLVAPTVHAWVHELGKRQEATAVSHGWPALLAQFGPTFLERALIDAYAARYGATLGAVLRGNGLGLVLADLHPELAGMTPKDGLPREDLGSVGCRHTVGLSDPLEEADLTEAERPADLLPVSLRAAIRAYGLREFKIKVAGEADAALDRLERVVALMAEETGGAFRASLDGNETFCEIEALRAFWAAAKARPALAPLWSRLMFVEQPLHRDRALSDEVGAALARWTDRPPLLIDESGAAPDDVRRALALGYVGVSHKNCKGVIHGVANRCLLTRRERERPQGGWQMSGEDLCNVGPIALPQDLAVQAALGNASVERNGQHYFAGLAGWPERVQARAVARYPGLYANAVGRSWPAVVIKAGRIDVSSSNREAFGGEWEAGLEGAGQCWNEVG